MKKFTNLFTGGSQQTGRPPGSALEQGLPVQDGGWATHPAQQPLHPSPSPYDLHYDEHERRLLDAGAWTAQPLAASDRARQEAEDAALALRLAQQESAGAAGWRNSLPATGSPDFPVTQQGVDQPPPVGNGPQAQEAGVHRRNPSDEALAEALRESALLAERTKAQEESFLTMDQSAVEEAMAASLSSAMYDDVLREIGAWIRDLDGASGDVAAAVAEVGTARAGVDAQLAQAGNSGDEDGALHRVHWLSEQYARVEQRLAELHRVLAPVGACVSELTSLSSFIQEAQPPVADAVAQRDLIIVKLFEALSRAGVDAHHPLGAWGRREDGAGASSSSPGPADNAQDDGLDLRHMVQRLIDDARRMPPPPTALLRHKMERAGETRSPTAAAARPPGSGFTLDDDAYWTTGVSDVEGKGKQALHEDEQFTRDEDEEPGSAPSAPVLPTLSGIEASNGTGLHDGETEAGHHGSEPELGELSLGVGVGETQLAHTSNGAVSESTSWSKAGERTAMEKDSSICAAPTALVQQEASRCTLPATNEDAIADIDDAGNDVVDADNDHDSTPVLSKTSTPARTRRPTVSVPALQTSQPTVPQEFHLSSPGLRTRRVAVRPELRDAITRLPPLVHLLHELERLDSVPCIDPGPDPRRRASSGSTDETGPVVRDPTVRATLVTPRETRGAASLRDDADDEFVLGNAATLVSEDPAAFTLSWAELQRLGARVVSSAPATVDDVIDLVDDIVREARAPSVRALSHAVTVAASAGGVPPGMDAGSPGPWPSARWQTMAATADTTRALRAHADRLRDWVVDVTPPLVDDGAGLTAEARRLAAEMEAATTTRGVVLYAHSRLRARLTKQGLPWDDAATEEVRWAAQAGAIALAEAAVERDRRARAAGKAWNVAAAVEPLAAALAAVLRVHQFAGGLSRAACAAATELMRLTQHYARMANPLWLRDAKFA